MNEAAALIGVGSAQTARRIAMRQRTGSAPGLFWLGGFRSDMGGVKATALDRLGERLGAQVTRFDYSGHGESEGAFAEGTITRWLEEAETVFERHTRGSQVVVGSSMGGWLALLLNRRLLRAGPSRIKALVLIAPAVDMTEELMRAGFSAADLEALERDGRVVRPSAHADRPDIITRQLIDDGAQHLLFTSSIETGCPVHIIQGVADTDVPHTHALKLASHLLHDEVSLSLIPDGDHRLSRPEDIQRLERAVTRAIAG